jgi:hypothetical protein
MSALLILLLLAGMLCAQPVPDTLWTYHINSDTWGSMWTQDVVTDSDGAVYVCGYQTVGDVLLPRIVVVKISADGFADGNFLSPEETPEFGQSVWPTADGGCIVSGTQYSFDHGTTDYLVVKLSATLEREWAQTYDAGGTDSDPLISPANNGWYITGRGFDPNTGESLVRVLKIAANGDSLWLRNLDFPGNSEFPVDVHTLHDNLYVCVQAGGDSAYYAALVRINPTGDVVWNQRYAAAYDMARGFDLTSEGQATILVQDLGDSFVQPFVLLHTDSGGNLVTRRPVVLRSTGADETFQLNSIVHTDAENVVVAGTKFYSNFTQSLMLAKVVLSGDTLWTQSFEGLFDVQSGIGNVLVTRDRFGSYVLSANVGFISWYTETYVIKTGPDNIGWLEGTIRNAETLLPVAGVMVRTEPDSAHALTNAQGRYELALRSGPYTIVYERAGFCPRDFENVVIENGERTVTDLELNRLDANFNITSINALWAGEELSIPFTISNPTTSCGLEFACEDTSWWLSVSPAAGMVPPGDQSELRARVIGWLPNPPAEYYSLIRVRHGGEGGSYIIPVTIFVTVGADENAPLPRTTRITDIYPNPFNPNATLHFELAHAAQVRIRLIDVLGREARVIEDRALDAGAYTREIDGATLGAGVYFVAFQAGSTVETQKIVLLK